ncbi:MAG: hypothetical protein ACLSGB_13480 [Dorea sp.]
MESRDHRQLLILSSRNKRDAKMLTGTPAELAKQLYDLIEEEKGK